MNEKEQYINFDEYIRQGELEGATQFDRPDKLPHKLPHKYPHKFACKYLEFSQ